jgi:hypothetical protein
MGFDSIQSAIVMRQSQWQFRFSTSSWQTIQNESLSIILLIIIIEKREWKEQKQADWKKEKEKKA